MSASAAWRSSILALFVLTSGQIAVVQAQITGSILATTLLGLGLAMLVGGLGRGEQSFNRANAGQLSTMLILLVIALLMPAVFDATQRAEALPGVVRITDEEVSLGIAVVLLLLYAANLVYTLITHRDVFSRQRGGGRHTLLERRPLHRRHGRGNRGHRRRGRVGVRRALRDWRAARPIHCLSRHHPVGGGGHRGRPLRRRRLRAAGSHEPGLQHLHRLGHPGGPGPGAGCW